ncbi:hypothetical protein [Rhizobium sp. LjRoot258]
MTQPETARAIPDILFEPKDAPSRWSISKPGLTFGVGSIDR